jgi:hypothetical protein
LLQTVDGSALPGLSRSLSFFHGGRTG